MENAIFIFKENKSIPYKIVSTLIFLWGILWLQYTLFGGIVLGLGSLFFFAYSKGVEINFEQHKFRKAKFLGNIPYGEWEEIPEIKYVSVFKVISSQSIIGIAGGRVTSREKITQINLIYGSNKRINVYKTDDTNDAFEKALFIAQHLNVKLFDATSRNTKWIDLNIKPLEVENAI
jgi:hypothetical protein